MKQIITIIITISLTLFSCSQKHIPSGLRKSLQHIDETINDTIRYDFMIAPEDMGVLKHELLYGQPKIDGKKIIKDRRILKTYFKIKGVYDSDDMNEILLRTYHRKLNNKPINFGEQKERIRKDNKLYNVRIDSLERAKAITQDSKEYRIIEKKYLSNFTKHREVFGYLTPKLLYTNDKNGYGHSETYLKFIAQVISLEDHDLYLRLIKLEKPESGTKLTLKIGDTIRTNPYEVFLISKKLE